MLKFSRKVVINIILCSLNNTGHVQGVQKKRHFKYINKIAKIINIFFENYTDNSQLYLWSYVKI